MQDRLVNRPRVRAPDRWVFLALLALLLWLPLPWGSTPPPAAAALGIAVALLAGLRLALALRGHALPLLPRAAHLVLALWLAWLAWGGLQLLPLPESMLAVLSPAAHAVHASLARPAYTLSILPGATMEQVLLGASYFGLFWLVLAVAARNRLRQRWILVTLVISGLGQAIYGSVMTLSGWEYGFLEPKTHGLGYATGTFVNRNHLAGYLELALAAGTALVLADLRPGTAATWREFFVGLVDLALSRRMRVRIMLVMMVVALVLTRSRGGNLAFFLSLAACGGIFVLFRHPRYFGKSLIFLLSIFAVDLLVVSEHYGLGKLAQRIEATDLDTEQRTLAFRDLEPVLSDHALLGSGLGTFGAAFSPHRSPDLRGYFDHAHNDHLEFIIEAGAVGYALLATIVVVTLAHGLAVVRRRRDPMAAALALAGCMGLVSLLIHGLADFNLRIPAVAATLVVLMALALSCSAESRRGRTPGIGP